jgi:hypothetical protein
MHFNQAVDYLPPSLTSLSFGSKFNQPLDHLPLSLRHLSCSSHFDQPVDHLPSSLTKLLLGKHFNQSIDNLPTSLQILHIMSNNFNKPLDHLPPLSSLSLENTRFHYQIDNLPLTLTYFFFSSRIWFTHPLWHLPPSLRYITLEFSYACPEIYFLPSHSLTMFKSSGNFNQQVDNLPPTLTSLYLGSSFNHRIDHLPSKSQVPLSLLFVQPAIRPPSPLSHFLELRLSAI